jgi:putative transposase
MSRYRLVPSPAQEAVPRKHCGHARYVWNLAVEQQRHWRPGRKSAPGYLEQCRQLTAPRAEHLWLAAGSQIVQQQALRDFAQARANYVGGTHDRPSWRKAGRDEGFRIVAVRPGHVRRLSRRVGEVRVPKAGWVRFRWSRAVPPEVKSYRVTLDRAGRWHVAFAVIPEPIVGPGNGQTVGIDRGIAVSAALSTGEMLTAPGLSAKRNKRLRHLQRKLARAKRGSNRRARVKLTVARLRTREADARKDWAEKASTDIARRFDMIRVEDLRIRIRPAFTSQRCSACGHVDAESRESQARFVCTACGFADHADVNAARNIAAGHAVTARGGDGVARPVNREPQLLLQSV